MAPLLLLLILTVIPMALAAPNFNQPLDPTDEAALDQILSPVMRVYNAVKYAATVIGVLVLVFAGISFITAGGEMAKKERAKLTGIGVIIGLIVIWIAPLVVQFFYR